MMVIDNKFEIGEIVYLITDEDQKKRVITALNIYPDNVILYELSCGSSASKHYAFEISENKDVTADA